MDRKYDVDDRDFLYFSKQLNQLYVDMETTLKKLRVTVRDAEDLELFIDHSKHADSRSIFFSKDLKQIYNAVNTLLDDAKKGVDDVSSKHSIVDEKNKRLISSVEGIRLNLHELIKQAELLERLLSSSKFDSIYKVLNLKGMGKILKVALSQISSVLMKSRNTARSLLKTIE